MTAPGGYQEERHKRAILPVSTSPPLPLESAACALFQLMPPVIFFLTFENALGQQMPVSLVYCSHIVACLPYGCPLPL